MGDVLTFASRRYVEIGESTIEHDDYMADALMRVGLRPLPDKVAGETDGDYGLHLLTQLQRNGERFRILGALIVPEGVPSLSWTPRLASETGEALKLVSDPDEKRKLNNLTLSFLIRFFVDGIALSPSTGFSSRTGQSEQDGPGDDGSIDTENGATSSGSSAGPTSTRPNGSIDGRFARRSRHDGTSSAARSSISTDSR